ncbi:MAG: lysophospholipid acyltransferase family protein [Candidatus Gastranaerophilales bacterium]|nr:lysophospholipid acyltransferase family protein [Candidatus Gastranaerophilales bacterium]
MASKYAQVKAENYKWDNRLAQFILTRIMLMPFWKIFNRLEIQGRENIPKKGNYIVCANHISYYDPPLVVYALRKTNIAFMAKEELFHVPILSSAIQKLGAFSVNREKLEIATIRSAREIFKTDWILGIFPEGKRIKSGKIGKANSGFAYLAKSAKANILPVGIIGADKFFGKITVKIGHLIELPENPDELPYLWQKAIAELTGKEIETETETEKETDLVENLVQ